MSAETLIDVFAPPEGMVGHSAVLVAMTGTEDFLEDAVQRFTGLRPRQRAELGNLLVYLMLDGHASESRQQVFRPGQIPGLHEFQPRAVDQQSLVHAKVALLGFAASRTGHPIHLRFAVLTANYTYTSARHQLELVWVVDVPLDGTSRPEDRADVAAAGVFVATLLARRFHRDEQALPPKERKLTARLDVPPVRCVVSRDEPKAALHPLARPLSLRPDSRTAPQRDRQTEELPSLRIRVLRGAIRQDEEAGGLRQARGPWRVHSETATCCACGAQRSGGCRWLGHER